VSYSAAEAAAAGLKPHKLAPFAAREDHPDCPEEAPHGTTDREGTLVMCHKSKEEAQDLALQLSFPDVTTAGQTVEVGAAAGLLWMPDLLAQALAKDSGGGGKGNAEKLHEYWVHGDGAAQIRWGEGGDWQRCVDHLSKFLADPKGYCALAHHEATGMWTAQHAEEDKAAAAGSRDLARAAALQQAFAADAAVEFAEWPDVELVAVGEWELSTGLASFTTADLQAAVGAADCPAVGNPVLKLGHLDPRFNGPEFDGDPAVGWVADMRLASNMTKVLGDYKGMPGWLGAILPSAYPKRSVEAAWNFRCQLGHVHPFVITAVALLGATPPGVGVIGSLNDIPALYGIDAPALAAAAAPTALEYLGAPMPAMTAQGAGVVTTIDDIRREFYEAAPFTRWIVELQLAAAGPVLIVCDDTTGALYRVPVQLDPKKPGEVSFGADQEVLVNYVDAPSVAAEAAKGGPGRRIAAAWASRVTSRDGIAAAWDGGAQVKALGDSPSPAQLKAMFALPGEDKSSSKLPHHTASDGKVGGPDLAGCQAAIGALNGGRGGLTGVSADDKKAAYGHLAAHVRALGGEPAELKASAWGRLDRLRGIRAAVGDTDADENVKSMVASLDATLDQASALSVGIDRKTVDEPTGQALDLITAAEAIADQLMDLLGIYDPDDLDSDEAAAAGGHGPHSGEHAHPHSAFGQQGGDKTHTHMHRHSGDAVHRHAHDPVSAAPHAAASTTERGSEVEFNDTQLAAIRQRLGLKDGEEVTPEGIAAAFTAPQPPAAASAGGQAGGGGSGDGDGDAELPPIGDHAYLVDGEILRQYQTRAAAGDRAVRRMHLAERDQILTDAVRAGKFPQSRLDHYKAMWDKDPDGARKHVEALAAGLVPVGTGPTGNPGFDAEFGDFEGASAYATLYPEDVQGGRSGAPGVAAAQQGR
jgi:hypothetical protein